MAKTERRTKKVEVDAEGKKTAVVDIDVTETSAERWDLVSITAQRAALAAERTRLTVQLAALDRQDADLAETEALLA